MKRGVGKKRRREEKDVPLLSYSPSSRRERGRDGGARKRNESRKKSGRGRPNGVISAPTQVQQQHQHGHTKLLDGYVTVT